MTANVVGNYKLVEKIGQGGMGAVYRGVDLMLEREVAIKVLRPELAGNPEILERFRTEAVTLAKLNHPNIATLYAFFRQGDDFFMVMEFVRGETLDHAIQRAGAMRVDTAVPVFCQALEGIGYAHKLGIVHRDIKPANMMLTPDGSIKVMDFGIARVLGSARMTKQGNIIGTIEYMSPEQVRGLETDARSDIYSLGILLYEMVTGRVPFASDSEFDLMKAQIDEPPPPPRQFAPHVPEMVEQAIMRSLAKMPEARFQTAGEFRNMLMSGAAAAEAPTRLQTAPPGVKETRLGAPVPTQPVAGQMKETRMAGAGTAQAYQPVPAFDFPPPTPRQPSLFARMTWKHYTAAALFLVVLMAVPFAVLLIAGGGNSPNPQPSANRTNSPTGASSTPSTGAQTGTSSTEQPVTSVERVPAPPPAVAPAGQLPGDTALGSAEPPSDKPAKTKDKKAADAAAREKARKKAAAERALDN